MLNVSILILGTGTNVLCADSIKIYIAWQRSLNRLCRLFTLTTLQFVVLVYSDTRVPYFTAFVCEGIFLVHTKN